MSTIKKLHANLKGTLNSAISGLHLAVRTKNAFYNFMM